MASPVWPPSEAHLPVEDRPGILLPGFPRPAGPEPVRPGVFLVVVDPVLGHFSQLFQSRDLFSAMLVVSVAVMVIHIMHVLTPLCD